MSTLALLQDMNASWARRAAAEEARRAALTPRQRWWEDVQGMVSGVLFWGGLSFISLGMVALAGYGAVCLILAVFR